MVDESRTDGVPLQDALNDAIHQAVRDREGEYVTKWIALVEAVDDDGTVGLWTMTSDNVMAWDTVGMLQHGLHLQQAKTLATKLDEN